MMMFLLLVGVVLLLLGGITGIVLFILGLVKHKPSMWGSGIVLGVLTLLLLTGGVVGLGYYLLMPMPSQQYGTLINDSAVESTTQADPNWEADLPAIDLQNANRYFKDHVGAALPEHVTVIKHQEFMAFPPGGGPPKELSLFELSIPANFETFVATKFKKAQWSQVKDDFGQFNTFRRISDVSLPEEGKLKILTLYTFTEREDTNANQVFATSIALAPNSRKAWVVGVGTEKQ